MIAYHNPVLLKKSIDYLALRDNGIYVDATFGGGGHSQEILRRNKNVKLFAFDQDIDAISQAEAIRQKYESRFTFIRDNFANLWTDLALEKVKMIDGIIFDLGISSHQIDSDTRGFSFSKNGKLDMRMDTDGNITAKDVINKYSYENLRKIFFEFGQERESGRIAKAIIKAREQREIETTSDLAEIIKSSVRSHQKIKATARIFQAVRIYLNRELDVLKAVLEDAVRILNPFGRIVVISYHSLEDKIIKDFFRYQERDCICLDNAPSCNCNKQSVLKIITKKPIRPQEEEMLMNNRARSAKMRIAEKKEIV